MLARVASADYFDERRAGQVDMTQALRSPGSTLKPFIYGIGFEDGLIHPETLIEDRPIRYGSYAPENFDLTFQGTVTVRKALQLSLNVPAVAVLDAVRREPPHRAARAGRLAAGAAEGRAARACHGARRRRRQAHRSHALYVGLARLGTTVPLLERRDDMPAATTPRRLLDPVAAWYVGNVLLGTPPPENAAAGRIAFKTGTSYGYRDAWSVGFDGKLTIGVWVGRPDGAPVPGLIGRGAAAPILFDAFARIGRPPAPLPPAPEGRDLRRHGKAAAAAAALPPGGALPTAGAEPLRILFPPNGARLELDAGQRPQARPGRAEGSGRHRAADRAGQRRAVPACRRPPHAVLRARRARASCGSTVMDARGVGRQRVVRLQ